MILKKNVKTPLNTSIMKDLKSKKTSKCPCAECINGVELNVEHNRLFLEFLGFEIIDNDDFYYVQIDHCDQELKIQDMHFHDSWTWMHRLIDKARSIYFINNSFADFIFEEYSFESIIFGDYKATYFEMVKFVKNHLELSDWTILNTTNFFKSLHVEFDTYSLSDCVEEIVEGMDEEYAQKFINKRDSLKMECGLVGIDFHAISCRVGSAFMNGCTKYYQKNEDRWLWVTRKDGEVVGINFQHGSEEDEIYDDGSICPHITEIYNRCRRDYDSDFEAINQAIDLFSVAFIFQPKDVLKIKFNNC
jgi:hypothetical protein